MDVKKVVINVGGRELSIETGRLAKQAHGSAYVQCGDSVVLVTACADRNPKADVDFLPLTVDYREYTYAAGKIPGGFFKREGRPTEREILVCRLIDRPLRPLFPEHYHQETQIIAVVLSAEPDINPDVLAINGASAALYISEIPFTTPVAAVRVGLVDGEFVLNPSLHQMETSLLDLVVVGTREAVVMVEAGAQEASEEEILRALDLAHAGIQNIIDGIETLAREVGKTKWQVPELVIDPDVIRVVEEKAPPLIEEALSIPEKTASYQRMDEHRQAVIDLFPAENEEQRRQAGWVFDRLKERLFRSTLLEKGIRPDRRAFDEIRSISGEVGMLPRTHGSALFTRGETQALVTVTLGTGEDVQRLDDLMGESSKRFMLHYNFPPFSVGEVRFLRGPSRREIGHGALAERAIHPILPSEEEFPYTIRIVSDILESNGSSSMASVCGGIMALQDAGVPIRRPVAGIAMGLVKEGERYVILSDIAGFEDHYGDMDFKVAGTEKGVTALQMDIKITGVTREIMEQALEQARRGRLFILQKMAEIIPESRPALSKYAPQLFTITIPVEKIGAVIGPGGKVIRAIVEETGTKIDIEDDGKVRIAATDQASAEKAIARIEALTAIPQTGKTYLGKVVKVVDFGAFVEILPGTEGLLHISEMAEHRIQDIRQEVHVGDQILVKVLEIDPSNKIRLSRRAVLRDESGEDSVGSSPRGGSSSRDTRPEGRERSRDRSRKPRPRQDRRGREHDSRRPAQSSD
ncbi:MAG TPA: polyribonucleotide nucleotidyltransferase [Acidobacteriota bacterium]|jgi:polyribonucleotide nucleotidyltransferase|nr:polyribonucleotide nucleotidyltransferase [Acidobacteriota bacterium]HRR56509.1 polyribonucleotide nucleotidyltransferase [Acidobacteriota bacterium]HRV08878.1 polyribonucleotide nucleotidyltransferase [Acidobacteriota bacterium]